MEPRPTPPPGHVPVLAAEVATALAPALGAPAVLVDGTLGLAGHAVRLTAPRPGVRLIGIDRDPQALAIAQRVLAEGGVGDDRATLVEATFDEVDVVLEAGGVDTVDAVLLDLGVSSLQLDSDDRGFAYSRDTPLDMRMGRDGPTAADIVNGYAVPDLARVLQRHGDERFARRIASAVARQRAVAPIRTTRQLVDIVYQAVPAAARREGGHPAKRTFQALRIEVNDELGALARALPAWAARLTVGGRLAVLSYHSGEDRLVKAAFRALTTVDVPPGLPVEPAAAPYSTVRPASVVPGPDEVAANPRAASARLRVIERTAPTVPTEPTVPPAPRAATAPRKGRPS